MVGIQAHVSDDWSTTWGDQRWNFYDGYYIPRMQVQGVTGLVGAGEATYNALVNHLNNWLAIPTDVTIDLYGEQVSGQTYRILTVIGLEETGTAKTVQVHLMNVLWNYPYATDGRYNNCVREGIELGTFDLVPGEYLTLENSFTFDSDSWSNQDDIRIAAYVQEEYSGPTAEVYQAEMMAWPFTVFSDCNENGIVDDQEAYDTAKLEAADGEDEDKLGGSVSLSGELAIAGARWDDDNGENAGAAYIYMFDGSLWSQMDKLVASDGATEDEFGYYVAVDGNVALVGALDDDDNGEDSGSAYVFRYDGTNWVQEAKLLASDGEPDDSFGAAVALSGEVAVVAARLSDDAGSSSGSVYVYRYDGANWVEDAKLTADDAAAGDEFGNSVSVGGEIGAEVVLVGSYYDDDAGSKSGSAYVFRYDGASWAQEAKLVASDAAEADLYGAAVAVDGDVAVVGSSWDDDAAMNSGSAYIYRYDGADWIEEAKLVASDGDSMDFFGWAVAIDGDAALIGASYDDDHGSKSGSAYLYRFDGLEWHEGKVTASDGGSQDSFGQAVAIEDDRVLSGAPGDNANRGSIYIYDGLMAADCNYNGEFDFCDIAWGTSEDQNNNGIPDECEEGCAEDVNGDSEVNIDDLFQVLSQWGACDDCPEDINGDSLVDIDDVFAVLSAWGPC